MPAYASLSIVVPTYNRSTSLSQLLDCLNSQTYPAELWEVVVVDDGSTDPGYAPLFQRNFNFRLQHIQQNHQGAVTARNAGAQHSQADILVFLDDDVIVEPGFLEGLVHEHNEHERAVIMGLFSWAPIDQTGTFKRAVFRYGVTQDEPTSAHQVDFIHCVSHNLSIKRKHFFEIGMFQDPTDQQGWPNWDDIDLAYRAQQSGFEFIQAENARGSHMDHALDDFKVHCERIYRAGVSAHWLFKKYPELQDVLPMFRDKTPIRIGQDSVSLILRKIIRRLLAWKPILVSMEKKVQILEDHAPDSRLLVSLYRWINSSYIYRGYRFGLSNFKSL